MKFTTPKFSPLLTPSLTNRCLSALPKLPRGEVYSVSNGENFGVVNFMTRPKTKYDSSYTPRFGEKVVDPMFAEVDMKILEVAATALGQKTPRMHQADESAELGEMRDEADDDQENS